MLVDQGLGFLSLLKLRRALYGRVSRDILYVYSDRTGKKIDHYFDEFSCSKVQIVCRSSSKSLGKSRFHARWIFYTASSKV